VSYRPQSCKLAQPQFADLLHCHVLLMLRQSDIHSSAVIIQAGFVTRTLSIYCEHGVLQQSNTVSTVAQLRCIDEMMSLIQCIHYKIVQSLESFPTSKSTVGQQQHEDVESQVNNRN